MLKVRKIRSSDKSRVIDITKDIWDGEDYMPLVFDGWLTEKDGMFVAAIDEKGEMIGFEKLTMVTKHDAWIEGLRKDMKSKVKGVGVFLTEYIFKELQRYKGLKTIRFATYIYNHESIALFSKMGFKLLEVKDYKFHTLPKINFIPAYKNNRAEVITNKKEVMNYVKRSKWLKNNSTGLCHSWVTKPVTEDLIKDYVRNGNCIGIRSKGELKALAILNIREKSELFIVFFEAENEKYALELLKKIKQTAYKNKQHTLCTVLSPKDRKLHTFFKYHRFKSWETEGDFRLFDFPVKKIKNYKFRNTEF